MFDIYGLMTKESLSLNREELNYDASKKICEDLDYLIDIYFELLKQNVEHIKDNSKLVDAYMLTSWFYEKEFPKLAVDLKEIYFVGLDESCKWKIISPISLDDSAKIAELSKEAFD